MTNASGRMRKLGGWLLAASALNGGCLSFCHRTGPPPSEQVAVCNAIAPCCRNHVNVFFVQGLDPLGVCNLRGVRDYVQSLGFIKTYYGQLYHEWSIAAEIRRLHAEDPHARFVLIGHNYGAGAVRAIARDVSGDNIFVDLVVYVGGSEKEKPANVGRLVTIRTGSMDGAIVEDAVNVAYSDVSFLGLATHQTTLDTLASELGLVAGMVTAPDPRAPHAPQESVPPRQMPRVAAPPDEWDFLKLRSPSTDPPAAKPAPPKEPVPPASSIG